MTQVTIPNNSSSLTFLANNTYGGGYPKAGSPAQWYIAGSNDLSTWTTILDQRFGSSQTDYNTQLTVNVSGYKYLRFGSGVSVSTEPNYGCVAYFNNMAWS